MSYRSAVRLCVAIVRHDYHQLVRCFSRKSISSDRYYKVSKPRKAEKAHYWSYQRNTTNDNATIYILDEPALAWRDTNFDLLASKHFPFFLPGEIGPAWYDAYTTVKELDTKLLSDLENNDNISCKIQACPKVLRQTVTDLFPSRNFDDSPLSVITLSIRPNIKLLRRNNEMETEKLTQLFVLSAQMVCTRLRQMGYWADFINPFSGKPYHSLVQSSKLYESDERFRCLDFQMYTMSECLIISNDEHKSHRTFVGNLFTNAPANKPGLSELVIKKAD